MNPFSNRNIIREPAAFFGRVAERHDLFNLLTTMQNCSLVGPRRIGKSSFLYMLAHTSWYVDHLPEAFKYLFIYIDLQELAGLGVEDLFYTIAERLQSLGHQELDINPERAASASGFRRMLAHVTDAGFHLVVCCDGFETLGQNSNFDADFFTFLRGMCSNYDLALVTSSRDSLYDLCHQGNLQNSQFWNIFVERSMGVLAEDEAVALIVEPLSRVDVTPSQKTIDFVLSLAGTHPFFIQVACYHLYEALHAGSDDINYSAIEAYFMDEARSHFAYEWNRLDYSLKKSLQHIARGGAIQLEPDVFHSFRPRAILQGSFDRPRLVSRGWQAFILEQRLDSPQPSLPPTAVSDPVAQVQAHINRRDLATRQQGSERQITSFQVGHYEIRALLGQGGMAAVYHAYDPNFKRDVAIKMLSAHIVNDSTYRARFEREALTIAALEHPAIVPVYDFGEENGQMYLVMRLMKGGSLTDILKHTALSIADAANVIARLASGLDETHALGIVHRDMKSANVLFDQYNNAFLSDFGIVQIDDDSEHLTKPGFIGTPAYMSPEQAYGDRAIDLRSDIYALGIILYEMLTGNVPYRAETPAKIMLQHIMGPVPDISVERPDIPHPVREVLYRALAKDPADRFASAGDMATALAAAIRQ